MPIKVIPNYNDINDWNFPIKEKSKDIIIGYMGSTSHYDDLVMVLPVIKKLMIKYPTLRFQMMGILTTEKVKEIFKDWDGNLLNRLDIV